MPCSVIFYNKYDQFLRKALLLHHCCRYCFMLHSARGAVRLHAIHHNIYCIAHHNRRLGGKKTGDRNEQQPQE